MLSRAEPRVIDFSRCGDWGHRVFVNSLPGLQQSYPERPLADLTGISPIVIEHLRELASKLRNQDGYWSQFLALSESYHTHLGDDVDGVLARLWREAWRNPTQECNAVAATPNDGHAGGDRKTTWTLDELWNTTFPELQFLVDTLIPEGLSLLVAAPKVGKSYWLATLIVCLLGEVAPFGKADLKPRGCDVLLITPDDPSARRLQNRILSIAEDLGLKREDLKHNLASIRGLTVA